ncbi:retrovirus-related pol polyprotein from transposon TNT 1-94 [Tanacetum coccineum]
MTDSPFGDSGFVVPVFSPGDDPIACLNKSMAFLIVVASSRFPSTNNQLKTSSNPRNQATIQDGRVIVQQVQERQGQNSSRTTYKGNATSSRGNTTSGQARVVKCYNCQGEGNMARKCTQPKRPRNAIEDLDTYDSDCDDLSTAQAVLMVNISNYGFDIILEDFEQTPVMDFTDNEISGTTRFNDLSVIEQMSEQMINHVNNWETANKE